MPESVGRQVITADGVVGTSGKAVAIQGYQIIADGTSSTVKFYDGTSTGGTLVFQGVTSTTLSFDAGGVAVMFTNGCYVDVDAHTTQVTVAYAQVL